jgi:hypothetical protein
MTNRRPSTIIAVTRREDGPEPVLERVAERATETGATVILYDIDASPSPLESPMPTNWSGDGEEEQFGQRLNTNDLEAAGQAQLADKVRALRAAGVDAYGWLPAKGDASTLVEYARAQAADLVLVSGDDDDLAQALGSADGGPIRAEAVAPAEAGRA